MSQTADLTSGCTSVAPFAATNCSAISTPTASAQASRPGPRAAARAVVAEGAEHAIVWRGGALWQ
jgi:hypothetical protein